MTAAGPDVYDPVDGPPRIVPELLRRRAAAAPSAVALAVDGGDALTYERWDRRSDAMARGMVARGVRPGDRVGLLFDNARWTDYAVAYVAAQKAGGVAVPLAPRFAPRELALVLAHCGAVGVVAPPDLGGPGLPGWQAAPGDLEQGQLAEPFQVPVGPGDLAEILYTSGTTGTPKGVACTHENVLFHDPPPEPEGPSPAARRVLVHAFPVGTNAGQEVLRLALRRDDRTVMTLPRFDAARFCRLVEEHRVQRLQLVPAMAESVLASGSCRRHDLSSVERVVLSSAPATPALFSRLADVFPKATFWNTYALTEAGTARTLMVHDGARPSSVGRPVGGTEVRVVDDGGGDVPAGTTGEVWLRRPGAPGRFYFGDPEATAATFVDGWVRTGDLGYLDDDGYLYLVDRKKDVIISGGSNVSSLEVEGVLAEHPAVSEAAVFGVAHPVLGQDVAAAVVASAPTSGTELQAFARRRLAEYKVPHRIVLVDELPRNASGKVLKRQLRERFDQLRERFDQLPDTEQPVAPRSPTEEVVAAVWREVLGLETVGVDDDFFALGGHSLAAAQVVARLQDAFGVSLSPTAVFESPTVAGLAAALGAVGGAVT